MGPTPVIVSKLFDRMLKARMEPALKNVSLFQTGSQSGKGAPDNLFLLRGAIDHSKYHTPIAVVSLSGDTLQLLEQWLLSGRSL